MTLYPGGGSYLTPGLSLLVPLGTNPLLLGSFSPTLLLETKHTETIGGVKNAHFGFCKHVITFGMSALSAPNVSSKQTEGKLSESRLPWLLKSHNSFFECDELLFFLLPALKVGIDQGLQLDQVFVLAFLLDVLFEWIPLRLAAIHHH